MKHSTPANPAFLVFHDGQLLREGSNNDYIWHVGPGYIDLEIFRGQKPSRPDFYTVLVHNTVYYLETEAVDRGKLIKMSEAFLMNYRGVIKDTRRCEAAARVELAASTSALEKREEAQTKAAKAKKGTKKK